MTTETTDATFETITAALTHLPVGVDEEDGELYIMSAKITDPVVVVRLDDTDTIVTVYTSNEVEVARARFNGAKSATAAAATVVAYLA